MGRLLDTLNQNAGSGGRLAAGRLTAPAPVQEAGQPSVGGFFKNAGSSAANFFNNVINSVIHPIKTVGSLGGLAVGLAEKPFGADTAQTKAVNAVGSYFKNRYGGVSNIGKTIYEDPIGFLADLSTVAGGAGALAKGVGAISKVADVANVASKAETIANAASKVAEVTDPLNIPRGAANLALKIPGPSSVLESGARRTYQSALKPSKFVQKQFPGTDIVGTGLEEGMNVSKKGHEAVLGKLEDVNTQIANKIKESAGQGTTVSPQAVAQKAEELKPRFAQQVSPQEDLAAIAKKQQDFLEHPKYAVPKSVLDNSGNVVGTEITPKPIPIDEAQAMKQGTYRELKGKYGQERTAGIEAEKAMARGLKEEIAAKVPEVAQLNAQDTKLMALEDALAEAVGRIQNRDVVGMKQVMGLAGNKASLLASVIDYPAVKSALAKIMYKASKAKEIPSFQFTANNPIINKLLSLSPTRGWTPKAVLTQAPNAQR